ncbi:hypothetical protein Tco_1065436, partial [Tanacetum coccineum]
MSSIKMEQAVEQHRVESKTFEVKMNQALNKNERLLEQVMSKDIVNLIVNSSMDFASEKVLVITTLKDELRKLKGKDLANNEVTHHPSDPEINTEPITPKLLNKRYGKLIQELLTNISQTCPSINNTDGKLVAVIPKNKDKRVRFTEPVTSLGNTITKTVSTSNLVSNKPMLSSTGVKPSTSASGSQPSGNTERSIRQTPSCTRKNKCNGCMLSDNHDLCVLDYINNVNARAKSKSAKKQTKRKVWKPKEKTPLRKPVVLDNEISKPAVTLVNSRKPRKSKTNIPVSKSNILQSVSANNKEPSKSWGSIISDVLSSSLNECRSSKLSSDFDELTAMDSEHSSSGPALHEMTPATISLGLVPNSPPSTLFVPPSRTDWDILFQPMFDELLAPPPSIDYPTPKVIAPIAKVVAPVPTVSTGSPSLTTIDQDAPSPSNSQTTPETQPPLIPNDFEEDNHDIEVAHMGNDLYFGIPIPEVPSDQSSSTDSIHTIVHHDHQIFKHNSKLTKDHPLENIIGELARPVSTRLQLHEQALFCYYDAFLT